MWKNPERRVLWGFLPLNFSKSKCGRIVDILERFFAFHRPVKALTWNVKKSVKNSEGSKNGISRCFHRIFPRYSQVFNITLPLYYG